MIVNIQAYLRVYHRKTPFKDIMVGWIVTT